MVVSVHLKSLYFFADLPDVWGGAADTIEASSPARGYKSTPTKYEKRVKCNIRVDLNIGSTERASEEPDVSRAVIYRALLPQAEGAGMKSIQ